MLVGPNACFTGKVGRRPSGVLGTTQGEVLIRKANVKDSHSSRLHDVLFVHHNVGVWADDNEAFKGCVDEVSRDIGRVHEVVTTDCEQGFDGVAELVE